VCVEEGEEKREKEEKASLCACSTLWKYSSGTYVVLVINAKAMR